MSDHPATTPMLGTAFWGWSLGRDTCFGLLDAFYARGGRHVDCATNYPLNGVPEDFRLAERLLAEWAAAHGVQDLRVTMKVGSLTNRRSPEHNLSRSFLLLCLDEYRHMLGPNLATLMVHWDNRDDPAAIADTLAALRVVRDAGLGVGLSGIRHPEGYAQATVMAGLQPDAIQMKHNLLQSDYTRYTPFHGTRCFFAYGINAGGVKLDAAAYHAGSSLALRGGDTAQRHPIVGPLLALLAAENAKGLHPPVTTFNACGLLFAALHPDIAGIVLGTSSTAQLAASLDFLQGIPQWDYAGVYGGMKRIAT